MARKTSKFELRLFVVFIVFEDNGFRCALTLKNSDSDQPTDTKHQALTIFLYRVHFPLQSFLPELISGSDASGQIRHHYPEDLWGRSSQTAYSDICWRLLVWIMCRKRVH